MGGECPHDVIGVRVYVTVIVFHCSSSSGTAGVQLEELSEYVLFFCDVDRVGGWKGGVVELFGLLRYVFSC